MKTERFIKNWEKDRSVGKTIFVLKYCIIMGMAMFLGSSIGSLFTGDPTGLLFSLFLMLGGLIGGIVGGLMIWFLNEERYRRFVNNDLKNNYLSNDSHADYSCFFNYNSYNSNKREKNES